MTTKTETSSAQSTPPLRALRHAKGLSLNEAARRAGMDPAYLSRVERGLQGISVPTLARLARVLGIEELKTLGLYARAEDGES
jgi:transcriptional regulator with XRE-family HTH domain